MIPRNLITWRWLVSAISLLDMMQGLRCAAPPRTCFASLSCLAPCCGGISSRLSCVRPPAHCATPLQQHTRALQSLSCTLPTSFPNGLLASPHTKTGSDAPVCVLDDNHVHVWMVQTDCIEGKGETFLESLRDTLSEDEMKRYKRSLVTPKAREQALSFLVARSLLRCTLSRYCPEIAPKCWRFEVNAYGRPALCSKLQRELSEDKSNAALQDTLQRLSKLRFNLSHCSGMVVCAFAYGREVGIDSEDVKSKRRITSIARRFFTASETAALLSVPEQDQALTFSRLWTLKEAYVKARGLGIAGVGLDNFEFKHVADFRHLRPSGSLVVDLSKAGDSAADWHFVMLDPPRQCANAAGSEEGQEQVREEQATRHAESSEQRKETRQAETETEELKEHYTRHAIAVVSSCAGGKAPAQLSVFRTIPLGLRADEQVDLSQVLVMSSHLQAAMSIP